MIHSVSYPASCHDLCKMSELKDDPGFVCWDHRVYVVNGMVVGELADALAIEPEGGE